jgi:hypothetical protein
MNNLFQKLRTELTVEHMPSTANLFSFQLNVALVLISQKITIMKKQQILLILKDSRNVNSTLVFFKQKGKTYKYTCRI